MSRNPIKAGFIAAALATAAGCAVDEGYRLPPLSSGGGGYSTYGPYVGGYYGYGGYYGGYSPWYDGPSWYDPRYSSGWYGPNGYGGSPYYGGWYGPPAYVIVPCADNNHDGRCDKRPRHPGDDGRPHDGQGGSTSGSGSGSNHHDGDGRTRDRDRDRDGNVRPRTGGGSVPQTTTSPGWQPPMKQPRQQPQLQPPPRRADIAPPEPKVRPPRDDKSQRQ